VGEASFDPEVPRVQGGEGRPGVDPGGNPDLPGQQEYIFDFSDNDFFSGREKEGMGQTDQEKNRGE
jgi:hypothetical protein